MVLILKLLQVYNIKTQKIEPLIVQLSDEEEQEVNLLLLTIRKKHDGENGLVTCEILIPKKISDW